MRLNYKRLGNYIREVKEKNEPVRTTNLLGVNIDKFFMPSVANIVGTDLSAYRIVKKNQFACNRMHVGRDFRLPIALSNAEEDFIVSPAYDVFEISDTKSLLPEYLMMWFTRSEFDRNTWFYTDADVRGGLPWKSFCEMQLPIPSPKKQQEIVKEYNTITKRIKLNEQLCQKLEATAQAIYKQWFVDFEFPDENGNPYKSSGGKMEYCKELERDLPVGWRAGKLKDIAGYSTSKINLNKLTTKNYLSTENMLQNRAGIIEIIDLPDAENVTKFSVGEVLISNIRPYFKKIWLSTFNGGCSNDILCFVPKKSISSEYLYYVLERDEFFAYVMAGSNGVKMPRGDKTWIMDYPTALADGNIFKHFNDIINPILNLKTIKRKETAILKRFSTSLLSKLATLEN
jgi:type I restriction enzyme S subunit